MVKYEVRGLTEKTAYRFKVRAMNDLGLLSGFTPEVTATTKGVYLTPPRQFFSGNSTFTSENMYENIFNITKYIFYTIVGSQIVQFSVISPRNEV